MLKLFITSCVILATFAHVNGAIEGNKFYFLRNIADNTYLRVSRPAEVCKYIGEVVTTSTFNKADALTQFRYNSYSNLYGHLDMVGYPNEGYHMNEVVMSTAAPACYFTFKFYNFHEKAGSANTYSLRASDDQHKCLTGNGNGKRISYTLCNSNQQQQYWEFIPV